MHIDLSALYPLYSIDPRAVWKGQLAVIIIVAAAAAVVVIPLNPHSAVLRWLKRCGIAGIAVFAALQLVIVIGYLFYPGYLNHAEASTAAVSWLGWEGYPLYPSLDTGDVYGIEYGPALYQITGFVLWLFGPSIGASKILSLVAFALSQVLCFLTLRRSRAGIAEALTMTGVQCVVLAGFTDQGYASGVRSDALLFLAAQTAVLAASSVPTMLTAGALGLLGGISANLKIHSALYILPAFVYCLCQSQNTQARLRLTGAAGLAAAIALAIPFIPHNVSLIEYYHYFQMLTDHPWERWLFEQNIVFAAMLVAPLLCLYVLFTPSLPYSLACFIVTTIVCMTLITFPAAESGAGPHHLLPFLPSLVWGFFVMRREVSVGLRSPRATGRYEGISVGLMAALLFGFGPIAITSWNRVLQISTDAPLVREGVTEINRALDDNPRLKLAVGPGVSSFDAQALRVLPVFRGNPLPIDSTAWMTYQADGVSDAIIRRAITECRVDLWLLPAGAPFADISPYNGEKIYTAQVLEDFHAAYRKQTTGRIFNQWRCKRNDQPEKRGEYENVD